MFKIKKLSSRKMQCRCSATMYVNFPYHLCSHRPLLNYLHKVALVVLRGGQELLPLKIAPIQPSVTAAFHLQSRRDSDCQIWELRPIMVMCCYGTDECFPTPIPVNQSPCHSFRVMIEARLLEIMVWLPLRRNMCVSERPVFGVLLRKRRPRHQK